MFRIKSQLYNLLHDHLAWYLGYNTSNSLFSVGHSYNCRLQALTAMKQEAQRRSAICCIPKIAAQLESWKILYSFLDLHIIMTQTTQMNVGCLARQKDIKDS